MIPKTPGSANPNPASPNPDSGCPNPDRGQRPGRLPFVHRLRSDLLNAPPFLAGTVLFGSASLIASTWDKPGHRQHRLARLWAKASLRAAGAKLQVLGLENLPRAENPDAPSLPQQGWEPAGAVGAPHLAPEMRAATRNDNPDAPTLPQQGWEPEGTVGAPHLAPEMRAATRNDNPDAPSLPQQGWETDNPDVPSVLASSARVGLANIRSQPQQPWATAVYAANHTSYMDTPVIFAGLPFQFRILAKKELWTLPFIGWYLNRSGQIPIDTDNPRATVSSLGAAVKTLRQGLSVFVFPEGGRTPDGHLQPFLNGAAYLAIRAQVPLVPVALVGVYQLLPIHTRHFYLTPKLDRTPLKLVIGQPIPTHGLSLRNADALTAQLRETIAALIQQHS